MNVFQIGLAIYDAIFSIFELKSQLFKQPKMYIFIQVYFWNLLEKYYMIDILMAMYVEE